MIHVPRLSAGRRGLVAGGVAATFGQALLASRTMNGASRWRLIRTFDAFGRCRSQHPGILSCILTACSPITRFPVDGRRQPSRKSNNSWRLFGSTTVRPAASCLAKNSSKRSRQSGVGCSNRSCSHASRASAKICSFGFDALQPQFRRPSGSTLAKHLHVRINQRIKFGHAPSLVLLVVMTAGAACSKPSTNGVRGGGSRRRSRFRTPRRRAAPRRRRALGYFGRHLLHRFCYDLCEFA